MKMMTEVCFHPGFQSKKCEDFLKALDHKYLKEKTYHMICNIVCVLMAPSRCHVGLIGAVSLVSYGVS